MERFKVFVVSAIVIKILLATFTPFGHDFALYMGYVLLNNQVVPWSPWIVLTRTIYALWLWLPIEHGDTLAAFVGSGKLLPGHYLLTALVKTPLLLSDVATGFLIYWLGFRLTNSVALGRKAAMLWFANPFASLFVEMWGSIDAIVVALALASIALTISGRTRLSAITLASGIALRMSPIVTWLALVAWVLRRKSSKWDICSIALAGPIGILCYLYWLSKGQLTYDFFFRDFSSFISTYTPVTQPFSEYVATGVSFSFVPLGLAVMLVTSFYLVAMEIWPRSDWSIVVLALSGILLLYGFADLSATAFLWAMPLIALWGSKNPSSKYPLAFFLSAAIFLLFSYPLELTTTVGSFFFLGQHVPPANWLAAAVKSLNLGPEVRGMFSGVSIAYAISAAWKTLQRSRG